MAREAKGDKTRENCWPRGSSRAPTPTIGGSGYRTSSSKVGEVRTVLEGSLLRCLERREAVPVFVDAFQERRETLGNWWCYTRVKEVVVLQE